MGLLWSAQFCTTNKDDLGYLCQAWADGLILRLTLQWWVSQQHRTWQQEQQQAWVTIYPHDFHGNKGSHLTSDARPGKVVTANYGTYPLAIKPVNGNSPLLLDDSPSHHQFWMSSTSETKNRPRFLRSKKKPAKWAVYPTVPVLQQGIPAGNPK